MLLSRSSKNWFGWQRTLESRKDNPRMADFRNNNTITNQKKFKPIGNSNVADSDTIALIDEPLSYWSF